MTKESNDIALVLGAVDSDGDECFQMLYVASDIAEFKEMLVSQDVLDGYIKMCEETIKSLQSTAGYLKEGQD